MNDHLRKPDFLIIGAPRAGTSWLWSMLDQHPGTDLPKVKEPFFFGAADIYSKGKDWYYDIFRNLDANKVTGEGSTSNFYDLVPYFYNSGEELKFDRSLGTIPQLITDELPDVKIFICLRDPVERAISHFNLFMRQGDIAPFSSIEAIDRKHPKMRLVEYGHYARFLRLWKQYVPPERMQIFFFEEDICKNPETTLRTAYKFLNLDSDFRPGKLRERVNASWGLSRILLHYYLGRKVARLSRRPPLRFIFDKLDRLGSLERFNVRDSDIEYLRTKLLPEKEELEVLLGRKLDCWKYRAST